VAREGTARLLTWALVAAVPHAAAAAASVLSVSDLSTLESAPSPAAPLDLVVNGSVHEPVQVVLRDGDALVPVRDLEEAGLRRFEGRREAIDGRAFVSLRSLAPALSFEVDEQALALRVTARQEILARAALDLRPTSRPAELEVRGDASGFLNYSVQRRTDDRTSGFAEAGVSEGGRLLYSSGQLLYDGTAARGLTSLTLDDVGSLRRVVVGDGFAASSGLGGGVLLGGLSLAREYGLDPYFVRAPMPQLGGFASTPSTLDVYVNGVLTRQVPLAPGGYDVTNLPVTAGAGNVRTVVRDAFGRTEALDWRYYYTPGLLAPGLSDYSYSAGFRRLAYGRESFHYGPPVFVARHRAGITDRLTAGGRFDAGKDFASAGPTATIGLPFGTLELEAAASAEGGTVGGAASAGYSFVSRRFSGGALLRLLGDRYAHAALRAADDRARAQTSLYAGAPLGSRVSVGLSWSMLDRRDAGRSEVVSARTDVVVARNVTLGVTGSRNDTAAAPPAYDVFASLSWAFAPLSVADATVQATRGGDSTVNAGAQRGLPAGTGFGYRARSGSGPAGDAATGLLQYQWDHGRYEAQYDRIDRTQLGSATVAGGVVFLGDRVFLTRPVQDGYGLIRLGVPGIRGFAEGQEIGRTDRHGDLLVPRLLPYYANRVGIADADVPVEYQIGRTELLAAPALRGGVVTRFDVAALHAVEGDLLVAGAGVAPAYGELRVRAAGAAFSSPIGGDGRFYLESLPAGSHPAEAEWSGGRCRVTLVVPASPPIADLGSLRCEPEPPAPILVRRTAPAGPPPSAKAPATAERATPTATPTSTATTTATSPATSTATPTATTTTTATPTATPDADAIAMISPAPPPDASPDPAARLDLPVPPPRGFGPRTPRCPSCIVCISAALHRLTTPTAQSRCVADLTVMQPSLGRAAAARMCLAKPDWDDLCSECVRMRTVRRCPTWPAERGAPRGPRPLGRAGGDGTGAREWDWTPFASGPPSWSRMSGFQDLPGDRSP
jgi:outer membrane usher protein